MGWRPRDWDMLPAPPERWEEGSAGGEVRGRDDAPRPVEMKVRPRSSSLTELSPELAAPGCPVPRRGGCQLPNRDKKPWGDQSSSALRTSCSEEQRYRKKLTLCVDLAIATGGAVGESSLDLIEEGRHRACLGVGVGGAEGVVCAGGAAGGGCGAELSLTLVLDGWVETKRSPVERGAR